MNLFPEKMLEEEEGSWAQELFQKNEKIFERTLDRCSANTNNKMEFEQGQEIQNLRDLRNGRVKTRVCLLG